jgi:hypothetical protein
MNIERRCEGEVVGLNPLQHEELPHNALIRLNYPELNCSYHLSPNSHYEHIPLDLIPRSLYFLC